MREASIGRAVVDEGVAAHLSHEEWHCEDGHDWDRFERLANFHAHLVLEVFWVLESRLVEDKHIAERSACEVDDEAEDPSFCR